MQSESAKNQTYRDCFLQIRRAKQTIFTDVAETTTVFELKQTIGNILRIDPNRIRLIGNAQIYDDDSKQLVEYGITAKEARPQNPFQLLFTLKLDDDSYEDIEIVPYSAHSISNVE